MNGIIYKITNKINGKVYIGKTVQKFYNRVKKGNYKSCIALNNAFEKYGWENFDKEEFICALDEKYLASLEELTIKYFNSLVPNGYNIIKIDKGLNSYPQEVCNKISEAAIARYAAMTEPIVAVNRKEQILIENILYRECNQCKKLLTLDNFNKSKARYDGLDTYCKPCARIKRYRPYIRKSEEEVKLSYKTRQNPEKIKQHYINNPESREKLAKKKRKSIIGVHVETNEIIEFDSALDAKKSGFNNTNLSKAIKKKQIYKKYIWRFK